jgi:hypothetical protein
MNSMSHESEDVIMEADGVDKDLDPVVIPTAEDAASSQPDPIENEEEEREEENPKVAMTKKMGTGGSEEHFGENKLIIGRKYVIPRPFGYSLSTPLFHGDRDNNNQPAPPPTTKDYGRSHSINFSADTECLVTYADEVWVGVTIFIDSRTNSHLFSGKPSTEFGFLRVEKLRGSFWPIPVSKYESGKEVGISTSPIESGYFKGNLNELGKDIAQKLLRYAKTRREFLFHSTGQFEDVIRIIKGESISPADKQVLEAAYRKEAHTLDPKGEFLSGFIAQDLAFWMGPNKPTPNQYGPDQITKKRNRFETLFELLRTDQRTAVSGTDITVPEARSGIKVKLYPPNINPENGTPEKWKNNSIPAGSNLNVRLEKDNIPFEEASVKYWLVKSPDGEVTFVQTLKGDARQQLSFPTAEEGMYHILAIVNLTRFTDGENWVSEDIVLNTSIQTVNRQEALYQHVKEADSKGETQSLSHYLDELQQQKADIRSSLEGNTGSRIKLKEGMNPGHWHVMNFESSNDHCSYQLEGAMPGSQYLWTYSYTQGKEGENTGGPGHHTFESETVGNTTFFYPQGRQPQDSPGIHIRFPYQSSGPEREFVVHCDEYVNGRLFERHSYIQRFVDQKPEKQKGFEALSKQFNFVAEKAEKVDGNPRRLNAVFLENATGRTYPLHFYYGRSKEDPSKNILLDLTSSQASKTVHDEQYSLETALESFKRWEQYPYGTIMVSDPDIKGGILTIDTDPSSTAQTWSSATGIASGVLVVAGAVLLLPTAGASSSLIYAGVALGVASSAFSIYHNVNQDKTDWEQLGLDIADIASSIATLGGAAFTSLGRASRLYSFGKTLQLVDLALSSGTLVYMSADALQEIKDINYESALTPEEQLRKTEMAITRLLISGSMLIFQAKELAELDETLVKKGLSKDVVGTMKPEERLLVGTLDEVELNRIKLQRPGSSAAEIKESLLMEAERKTAGQKAREELRDAVLNAPSNFARKLSGLNDITSLPAAFVEQAIKILYHAVKAGTLTTADGISAAVKYLRSSSPELDNAIKNGLPEKEVEELLEGDWERVRHTNAEAGEKIENDTLPSLKEKEIKLSNEPNIQSPKNHTESTISGDSDLHYLNSTEAKQFSTCSKIIQEGLSQGHLSEASSQYDLIKYILRDERSIDYPMVRLEEFIDDYFKRLLDTDIDPYQYYPVHKIQNDTYNIDIFYEKSANELKLVIDGVDSGVAYIEYGYLGFDLDLAKGHRRQQLTTQFFLFCRSFFSSPDQPIKGVSGKWLRGRSYPNQISDNLRIFLDNYINKRLSKSESAMETPTGKIARFLGYNAAGDDAVKITLRDKSKGISWDNIIEVTVNFE